MPYSARQWAHNSHRVPPGVAGALGPMGRPELSSIPTSCSERQPAIPKSARLPLNMDMLSGGECHPGAPSGLTTWPRYPLKWQGHWALWVSQILKHTNFLLKTMPKSARLPLNMGMANGVKGHPGPSSGPTTCPSCTLKWQGHQDPWDVPHSQP